MAEGKHKGFKLPKVWDNKQVLRYEFRYMRKPHHYQQVNKIRLQIFTKDVMNDSKLFEKQLILLGLQALGGEQEVLNMIDRGKSEGKFSNRMQASRLKGKIEKISHDKVLTEESELISELDQKVKQAVQFYR